VGQNHASRYRTATADEEADWQQFITDLLGDSRLGEPAYPMLRTLAEQHVATLRRGATDAIARHPAAVGRLTRTPRDQALSDLKGAAYLMHRAVRFTWGPLLIGFLDWVWSTLEPGQVAVFLQRDAGAPYLLSTMAGNRPFGQPTSKLYLSRRLLGIRDQWSGPYRWGRHRRKKLLQYLRAAGFVPTNADRLVLVDTGTYGSLVSRLAEEPFGLNLQARFMFSKNRYIPGWLNTLGIPAELAELIMDSVEFGFPQKYRPPTVIVRETLTGKHVPKPELHLNGPVSCYLYEATGRALAQAQRPLYRGTPVGNCQSTEGQRAVRRLIEQIATLHQQAVVTGAWTGVLHCAAPLSQDQASFERDFPPALRGVNPRSLLHRS
jgi:hypothetical protein